MLRQVLSLRRAPLRAASFRSQHNWTLAKHPKIQPNGPVLVAVLDGVGAGKEGEYDAVFQANTPTLDSLRVEGPRYRTVLAHGKAVGLPSNDDMGNSEVGHNALGCGRIVTQGAGLVDNAIRDESLFAGKGWAHLQSNIDQGGTFHMIGLLSDGGVHSRYDQIIAVMKGAAQRGAKAIRLHVLLDGRDVPDGTSVQFTADLEAECEALRAQGVDAQIASGGGRMGVTMDRYDADWSIVERGWQAHVLGTARPFQSASEALRVFREEDPKASDQYLPAFTVCGSEGKPVGAIQDGDSVLCFNFRGDRVIELSKSFDEGESFDKFDRVRVPKANYAGIMCYDGDLGIPKNYLVEPPTISHTSGEYLANNGVRTFAVSETQKFGHVTYFWNGNRSGYFCKDNETFEEIESDRCEFNEKPDMKAQEIADTACAALRSGKYDCVRLNLANGDMVGHTGDMAASVRAMETVDKALKQVLDAVDEVGGSYVVTADHGNCDQMAQTDKQGNAKMDENGNVIPLTSHTLAPVPIAIGGALPEGLQLRHDLPDAGLPNITATFMNLLGYTAPADYEPSLLCDQDVKSK